MSLSVILKQKNFSQYKLAKVSQIPQSTISDLCLGKSNILDCSLNTILKISKTLNVTIDEIINSYGVEEERISFDLFKSQVCHELKRKGDIGFIIETLESDEIINLYTKKWYPECFYMLAMLDYISKENNVPICSKYSNLRNFKLENTVYPLDIILMDELSHSDEHKKKSLKEAIPEFLKYNIVESEIRDVY